MTNEHIQLLLTHNIEFSKNFAITTNGYFNRFERNWYKLNDITANGDNVSIANIVSSPDQYPTHFSYMTGLENSPADALTVKANNRKYISKGVQTKLDYHFYGENTFHDIELGLRYHYDEEDRFRKL